jgi:MFS family permease
VVFGDPVLRTLVLFGWLAGFAVVPEGLAAPYAHALRGGPVTVGLLMTAMPAGMIIGAFVLGRMARPSNRLRSIGWLAMLSCGPLTISLLHPPLPLVLLLWMLAGAGASYQLAAAAAFARVLRPWQRARAFGIAQSGLLAAQGLGILAAGALAARIGPQPAVALAGAGGLLAAAALATNWTRQHSELATALGGDPLGPALDGDPPTSAADAPLAPDAAAEQPQTPGDS